jgi:hypothetical protein
MFEVVVPEMLHRGQCEAPEGESYETPEEPCDSVHFVFEEGLLANKMDGLRVSPEDKLIIAVNQLRELTWNENYKALHNVQFWHNGFRLLSFESPYLEKRKDYSVLDVVQPARLDKTSTGEHTGKNLIIIKVKANGEKKPHSGYEIIQIFTPEELVEKQRLFLKTEEAFPEFDQNFIQKWRLPYVLGGFAAYGNPSSFHNSFVKNLRKLVKEKVIKNGVFKRYLKRINKNPSSYKMELLFDRMLHRYGTQKPNAESVHRDITPPTHLHVGDVVFGGWLNLSHEPQSFSCVPASHLPCHVAPDTRDKPDAGFMKLKDDEIIKFRNLLESVSVPAGHLLIFNQTMVHEVVSKPAGEQMRLFMGWRLTTSEDLLFGQKKKSS